MVKENNEKRLEYLKNIVLNMPEKPAATNIMMTCAKTVGR